VVKAKRIYEPPSKDDGYRIFVERLWPRGFTKERARFDLWFKDITPSPELHKWFHHDPERWNEFKKKYRKELEKSGMLLELKRIIREKKIVDLVYSTKSEEHNNAIILIEFLKEMK
jgi:uncharacterized protein YeaO (DUF488 family)